MQPSPACSKPAVSSGHQLSSLHLQNLRGDTEARVNPPPPPAPTDPRVALVDPGVAADVAAHGRQPRPPAAGAVGQEQHAGGVVAHVAQAGGGDGELLWAGGGRRQEWGRGDAVPGPQHHTCSLHPACRDSLRPPKSHTASMVASSQAAQAHCSPCATRRHTCVLHKTPCPPAAPVPARPASSRTARGRHSHWRCRNTPAAPCWWSGTGRWTGWVGGRSAWQIEP